MKGILSITLFVLFMIVLTGCSGNSAPSIPSVERQESTAEPLAAPAEPLTPEQPAAQATMPTINIKIANINFTATLYDNESARTIVQEMPFTLNMEDFALQEKIAELTFPLPSAQTETPATIKAGDLSLWSGNNLVLFYTTFSNAYRYVPVGYIEDVTGLQSALGNGTVTLTFSANE
ncbi:hypothetical protein D3C75_408510 [compost metagenome]